MTNALDFRQERTADFCWPTLSTDFGREVDSVYETYDDIHRQVREGSLKISDASDLVNECFERIKGWQWKYSDEPAHMVGLYQQTMMKFGEELVLWQQRFWSNMPARTDLPGLISVHYKDRIDGAEKSLQVRTEDQKLSTYFGRLNELSEVVRQIGEDQYNRFVKEELEGKKIFPAVSGMTGNIIDCIAALPVSAGIAYAAFDIHTSGSVEPRHIGVLLASVLFCRLYVWYKG